MQLWSELLLLIDDHLLWILRVYRCILESFPLLLVGTGVDRPNK